MVASWYGREFHGRPTASGDVFNMYDYTAAHRTFAFGTKLKILNPQNGRSVIVKINDRGPFVDGRDIDLSYASAREIGIINQGTAEVIADYLERDVSYVRPVEYTTEAGPFTIQVAAFSDIRNPYRLKSVLELSYPDTYIMKALVNGEPYYRVRIGRFLDRGKAEQVGERLAEEGYQVIIMRYEEE